MKGNVSPIHYDATHVEDLKAQINYLPASNDDVFGKEESFAVSMGEQVFRCFMSDITVCLTREQIHALKHELDKVCGEYPLPAKAVAI